MKTWQIVTVTLAAGLLLGVLIRPVVASPRGDEFNIEIYKMKLQRLGYQITPDDMEAILARNDTMALLSCMEVSAHEGFAELVPKIREYRDCLKKEVTATSNSWFASTKALFVLDAGMKPEEVQRDVAKIRNVLMVHISGAATL